MGATRLPRIRVFGVFVPSAFAQGGTAHEVEKGLWERLLKLGHALFQGW